MKHEKDLLNMWREMMSDSDWTISFLSSVAGTFVSKGEGELGTHYVWATDESSDYWMQYIVSRGRDHNSKEVLKQAVVIHSFPAPEPEMYTVIGYCKYHDIQCEIDESLPDSVCGEAVKATAH